MNQELTGWRVYADPAEVMPINDLRDHAFGMGCWCTPTRDDDVIVHHALDNREWYERGGKPA